MIFRFFFFNDTATTEIYTLSLHDALPISTFGEGSEVMECNLKNRRKALSVSLDELSAALGDRKSTRLNSSHSQISYAVFCLKKKIQLGLENFTVTESRLALLASENVMLQT